MSHSEFCQRYLVVQSQRKEYVSPPEEPRPRRLAGPDRRNTRKEISHAKH